MSETQLRSGQMSGTNGRATNAGRMGNGGLGMGGQLSRKNLIDKIRRAFARS